MSGLLVCRMCLASEDVKLCSLSKYKLVEAYEFVTGNHVSNYVNKLQLFISILSIITDCDHKTER